MVKQKNVVSFNKEKMENQINEFNKKIQAWEEVKTIVCDGCEDCTKTTEDVLRCLKTDKKALKEYQEW